MKTSKEGIGFLTMLEGYRENLYDCPAGCATIGIGHKVSDCNIKELKDRKQELYDKYKDGLKLSEAQALLSKDLAGYEDTVKKSIDHIDILEQRKFDALVSLCFNIGRNGFKSSSLVKVINTNYYASNVITEKFKLWNKITINGQKVISNGLNNRRIAEAKLFTTGIY